MSRNAIFCHVYPEAAMSNGMLVQELLRYRAELFGFIRALLRNTHDRPRPDASLALLWLARRRERR